MRLDPLPVSDEAAQLAAIAKLRDEMKATMAEMDDLVATATDQISRVYCSNLRAFDNLIALRKAAQKARAHLVAFMIDREFDKPAETVQPGKD